MKQFLVGLGLAVTLASPSHAQEESAACRTGIEACHVDCKRFDFKDPKRAACDDFCGPRLKVCGGSPKIFARELPKPAVAPVTVVEPPNTEVVTAPISEAATESAPASEAKSEINATATSETPSEISADAPAEAPASTEPQAKAEAPAEMPVDTRLASPAQTEPATTVASFPSIPVLTTKRAVVKEADQNLEMLAAIASGNQKIIRRLIESKALNPTFVYSHDFNTQTRQYEGRIVGLRLVDILNDTSTLRTSANDGLDRVFALFLELGMDVTAKLNDRTAWGPSLRTMEGAKDRDARLRTFDMALEAGLLPNSDLTEWLFAELPQVCGRDRSKFAISVVDVLIKRLGPTLKDNFWRESARGPETLSDVLDLSFAQPGKTAYEKELAAEQDKAWENCAPLSRRINRFLVQGN